MAICRLKAPPVRAGELAARAIPAAAGVGMGVHLLSTVRPASRAAHCRAAWALLDLGGDWALDEENKSAVKKKTS